MNAKDMARALGRRGGRARARNLSAVERQRIASLGGAARRESLVAARRIIENLQYAAAAKELRGAVAPITRTKTCRRRLPGPCVDPRHG